MEVEYGTVREGEEGEWQGKEGFIERGGSLGRGRTGDFLPLLPP